MTTSRLDARECYAGRLIPVCLYTIITFSSLSSGRQKHWRLRSSFVWVIRKLAKNEKMQRVSVWTNRFDGVGRRIGTKPLDRECPQYGDNSVRFRTILVWRPRASLNTQKRENPRATSDLRRELIKPTRIYTVIVDGGIRYIRHNECHLSNPSLSNTS